MGINNRLILRSSRDPLIPRFAVGPKSCNLQIIYFFSVIVELWIPRYYVIRYIESGTVRTNTSKMPRCMEKAIYAPAKRVGY
jgi:hypothetical protein